MGVERATLADVLIDDVTWSCATRARRAEWLQAMSELVDEARFELAAPLPDVASPRLRAYITVESSGILVALHDPRGRRTGGMTVSRLTIAPVFREYMKILTSIGGSNTASTSPQLEALDIARRLTHDDAAELLSRHFERARPDHKTARRLFTLLVLLTHDTTRLQAPSAWTPDVGPL